MSKFAKRVSKTIRVEGNALVVGDGFGFLTEILKLFESVFVVLNDEPRVKSKNIIYRDTLADLHLLPDITVIFVDLKNKHRIDEFEYTMIRSKPIFLIEGNDCLSGEWTKKMYKLGYRAVDQQGYFHQWKKIQ